MIVKIIYQLLATYLILLSAFALSLILACMIPSSYLESNIAKSISVMEKEGIYPVFGVPWRQIGLDNFTDSIMLNTAYSVDESKPAWSAFVNYRYEAEVDSVNQVANLKKLYTENAKPQTGNERYWHGYLVYLRPLLTIFSYNEIRILLTAAHLVAFALFVTLSWKRLGRKKTAFFVLGLLSVDYFYLSRSMQFSAVFLIALLSAVILLKKPLHKNQLHYLIFFIVGAITTFFDLLTAPLVTLGLILLITASVDKNIMRILLHAFFWSLGYLSLWFSKWALVQLFFTPQAISTALHQIMNRTITQADANFSHLAVIKLNFFQLIGYNKTNKVIVLSFAILLLLFLIKYFRFDKQKIKNILPWILIGFMPYGWYLIAANHSYIHVWFTYRIQLISVVSLFFIASEFIDWKHFSKDMQTLTKGISSRVNFTLKNHKN